MSGPHFLQPLSTEQELAVLRPLSRQFPNLDAALAEIARLAAELTLPKGTVHVISDVHGEYAKLRHVINNASGTLRPLVEQWFAAWLTPAEIQEFLAILFYPRETLARLEPQLQGSHAMQAFASRTLRRLFELMRLLARTHSLAPALRAFPVEYRALLEELLHRDAHDNVPQAASCFDALVAGLVAQQRALVLIRLTVRVVRNLTIEELIIAGDCWDRGPRGDLVMDYLQHQPNVVFTWGNHDAAWLGACLGDAACIAEVLRISLRYRRLSQLEEGYGITLQPLEHLVRAAYEDDPAECFIPHGTGLRETPLMARMQKAAAVLQFKLEGQTIARNPQFQLQHRRLLHTIDPRTGTVVIDGVTWPLRDARFPTIDPADPYALSPEERACMDRTRQSFLGSRVLWDQMRFLTGRGSMYLKRDDNLIFHGCVPVDAQGEFLPLEIDGRLLKGRALFDALDRVVVRAMHNPDQRDLDLLWYLWCGPLSPLFGKDRITTFENDLIADPSTHVETKNPYFQLIHDAAFCERVLAEFGADPERGLIVNGHVPVKIDKGESPLKRSGKAITIDGAFSSAYGDHGYTLVLEPERTFLAMHHHFESVEAAVRDGVDIIPTCSTIREWRPARRIADVERGEEIRLEIELLERLAAAYRANRLRQTETQAIADLTRGSVANG